MFNILRNRTIVNLLVLVVLGVAMGYAHNKELATGRSLYFQDATRAALAPVEMTAHSVFSVIRVAVLTFRPRAVILKENRQLRDRVKELTAENARLREAAHENVALRASLGFRESVDMQVIAAEVVSRKQSNWFDTASISVGSRAGVKKGAAVMNHLGLIGQISDTDPFSSHVVALTDAESRVAGMVQRSRSSGMLYGQGGDYLVLAYLPKDADVKVKDIVVSSGVGGVVPKGLVVGRVTKVVRNSTAGTTSALVRPSVRFDEVEQVLVVKNTQALAQ